MASKLQVGDRVRIQEKLFPSYNAGLFEGLPKTGTVVVVESDSILPYQVKIDTFEHHPFWFYEDQLLFEDPAREAEWVKRNQAVPRKPSPSASAATTAGASHEH